MTGRFERIDARPGGSYRMILTYADTSGAAGKATADSDIVEARFVDLVPDVRVVQAVDFVSDEPGYADTMIMTWEVATVESGTRVEIRADNVPDGISAEDHAAWLASSPLCGCATLSRGRLRGNARGWRRGRRCVLRRSRPYRYRALHATPVRRPQPSPTRQPSALPQGSTSAARTTRATGPRRRGSQRPGTPVSSTGC